MEMITALAAEELEHLKTNLFSALAHELRTPLASLRLAAGLLVIAPPPGAAEEHYQLFQLLLQSSDRLDVLVTSLLDYARLQANQLPLDLQALDLRLILESVAALLEPRIHAKRLDLSMTLPTHPVTVLADPFRLKSALQAVLEAACQRCPERGKLRVGCQRQEESVRGWICDTGAHLPAAARAHVFTQSYWLADNDSLSLAGFGLGLPMSHGLLALHGGSLWIDEPASGEDGMCFHFRLPHPPA